MVNHAQYLQNNIQGILRIDTEETKQLLNLTSSMRKGRILSYGKS